MTFSVAPLNDFGRDQARYADRHDLIVIAVQDESWYIEPHQIFREISLGKGFNAFVDGFVPFMYLSSLSFATPKCSLS